MRIEFAPLSEILAARSRRRSAHYADVRRDLYPPPRRIGRRASGWPRHEIEAVNRARLAGASDDDVRMLVAQLVEARKAAA